MLPARLALRGLVAVLSDGIALTLARQAAPARYA
jgi:hypothetical protein